VNKNFKNIFNGRKGFTLVEMLVYIAVLSIISGAVITMIAGLMVTFNKARVKKDIMSDADIILRSITSEVKYGNLIYSPTSIFDSSSGQLSINTALNATSSEAFTYVDFYLDNGRVYVKKEGSDDLPLNSERTKVTELKFTDLTPDSSLFNSIRIKLTLESLNAPISLNSPTTFYTAASMRGSY
jgi:prepilin-type N-terminal cleavage/methylation domain-containing protein